MSVSAVDPGRRADFSVRRVDGLLAIRPTGDWTVFTLGDAPERLNEALAESVARRERRRFDASELGSIDTVGALALAHNIWADRKEDVEADLVGRVELGRLRDLMEYMPGPADEHRPVTRGGVFERFGRSVASFVDQLIVDQTFMGRMMVALGRALVSPRRLRPAAVVTAMGEVGLKSLPIVFFMTFFIGAILALVGSTMLRSLGVEAYTVDMVGVGVMREFGVVVTAILLAGRSAAAFAAQLGAMRMNQETDAMEVMGVDLFDALVVPRVLAALVMMPIMTLVSDIGGLVGGMLVSWWSMGITPSFFLHRLVSDVGPHQFWVGLSKAPLFALAVSATGCRHGLATAGDVGNLGERVTDAVVQAIFMIIMFDALFAALLMVLTQ